MRNKLAHNVLSEAELMKSIDFPRSLFETVNEMIQNSIRAIDKDGKKFGEIKLFVESNLQNIIYVKLCTILTAASAFEAIVCGPGRLRLGLSSKKGQFFNFDEAPEWAKEQRRASARLLIDTLDIHNRLKVGKAGSEGV